MKRANMACRSSTSSSVDGARDRKVRGGSGTEDGASGQMSSSVCQGGIDTVSWGPTAVVLDGEASQSDSAAREMASRRFLRWRDAATPEEGNEGEEKKDDDDEEEEEEEVEKSELEDMFVVSFCKSRVSGRREEGGRWWEGCFTRLMGG